MNSYVISTRVSRVSAISYSRATRVSAFRYKTKVIEEDSGIQLNDDTEVEIVSESKLTPEELT